MAPRSAVVLQGAAVPRHAAGAGETVAPQSAAGVPRRAAVVARTEVLRSAVATQARQNAVAPLAAQVRDP
ncbi:MAG TPA: hypothetical protein VH023_05770 [Rhodopila sp.]|nr:hypothetical protein [Rhodopila sp.]